jgi:Flp pilus assembly protein TadD
VTRRAVLTWARQRTAVEWLALAAGAAAFGYVGWDLALWDARIQLLLHLLAVGALAGVIAIAVRGGELPISRIDLPILGLLAAYALATLFAINVGMSLRAMGAVLATAAMLPVALVALRHRPTWTALVVCVPSIVLAAGTLAVMAARRVQWVLSGAPGLPPIRMPAEGTPFGSVAVPPFVLLGCWALAGAIEAPAPRRTVRTLLLAAGIPLTLLSGSRAAWLAIVVTLVLLAVPVLWARRRRLRLPVLGSWSVALAAVGGLLLAGISVLLVLPRLTAVSSLLYRGDLWRDTLAAASANPLLGLGPGIMPYARQAAAPALSFPVSQPHSHNLLLGVFGDAGLIGLAAATLLVVATARVAGPGRSRTTAGRTAAAVLAGLAISGLFEDLTFLPNFNLIVLLLVAIALRDAGAVRWVRPPRLAGIGLAAGAAAMSIALLPAMVVADAGAIAYRRGIEAAAAGEWGAAAREFGRSVEIDPWHPAGPDALGVALVADERLEEARTWIEEATRLNPGNGRAWANLGLVCLALDERECAQAAARRALEHAPRQDATLANAALVLDAIGREHEADVAYRRSLLTHPLTAAAVPWPRPIDIGDGRIDEGAGAAAELHLLLARATMGTPTRPSSYVTASVRALAHASAGQIEDAERWMARAREEAPAELLTWEVEVAIRYRWHEPYGHAARVYEVLRGRPLPAPDDPIEPPERRSDLGSLRMLPGDGFVSLATDLRTEPLYPWILGELIPERGSALQR